MSINIQCYCTWKEICSVLYGLCLSSVWQSLRVWQLLGRSCFSAWLFWPWYCTAFLLRWAGEEFISRVWVVLYGTGSPVSASADVGVSNHSRTDAKDLLCGLNCPLQSLSTGSQEVFIPHWDTWCEDPLHCTSVKGCRHHGNQGNLLKPSQEVQTLVGFPFMNLN